MELIEKNIDSKTIFWLKPPRELSNVLFSSSTRSFSDPADFYALLKIEPKNVVGAEQVHGSSICRATKRDAGKVLSGCDALITDEANVPIAVRTADCVPIFILDKARPVIGLVHAGWRGTSQNISTKTTMAMSEAFDTKIKNCIIAIAPSIGPCCYEVGEEVFPALRGSNEKWREALKAKGGGKWMVDLAKLNELELIGAGVLKENIVRTKHCTCCEKEMFYSFRGQKTGERMYSVAMIKA
jgi:hypothetical protein